MSSGEVEAVLAERPIAAASRAFFFVSGPHRLFGVWRAPSQLSPARVWVFCAPFAEEEKSARRTLAELGEALRACGDASLLFSYSWINRTLDMLEEIYGGKGRGHAAAAEVNTMLDGNSMDRIFAYGLHEFLTEFIARNNQVTEALAESYNFY